MKSKRFFPILLAAGLAVGANTAALADVNLLNVSYDPTRELYIVMPPLSILAEPPVSVVDRVVDKHGTRQIAQAYLEYL